MTGKKLDVTDLSAAVISGDRAALARAITLVESVKSGDRALAGALLQMLLPKTGGATRIGITGAPGVGKSTLIDRFGLYLIDAGLSVAVLAIDPSSSRSGGSILADKTRMARLATNPRAFIRPTPSAGTLGGAARRTRETMLVCEAAGFDVVIVETVGIGQSETVVADIVDFFAVLVQPGGGDELQGLKKGVIEVADMIAVTKADGDMADAAARTAGDYRAALNILAPTTPVWRTPVIQISAFADTGLDQFWAEILRHRDLTEAAGLRIVKRREQDVRRLRILLEEQLVARFFETPGRAAQMAALEERIRAGEITPGLAADEMLPPTGD